jgi:glycogen debranching enzyme
MTDQTGGRNEGQGAAEAVRHALAVVRACQGPLGFRASATPEGYPELWARDAAVTILGIAAAEAEEFRSSAALSLRTLGRHQSRNGCIPVFVHPSDRRGTANAGALDATAWFLVAHLAYQRRWPDGELLDESATVLPRAVRWLACQDSDEDGLVEIQEAATWADLLAYRGKTLYDNILSLLAFRAYAALAAPLALPDAVEFEERAEALARQLNIVHWVGGTAPTLEHEELERLRRRAQVEVWHLPYYLPWVGFRQFGTWCDVLGNALAILAGLAGAERSHEILSYLESSGATMPYPARSLYPPILPGTSDWREYYLTNGLNLPHHYQNGGVWPFIGGFVVAAEVAAGRREIASRRLERLTEAVRLGPPGHPQWGFVEWLHGLTGQPMGRPYQAWSAAMFLYASRAVATGRAFLLPELGLTPASS